MKYKLSMQPHKALVILQNIMEISVLKVVQFRQK